MEKSKAYSKVVEIGEKENIDIKEYLLDLAMNDRVTPKVLNFIHGSKSLDDELKDILKSKPLYKTLMTLDDDIELAKAVSSFITHILIEYKNNPENIDSLRKIIEIEEILDGLSNYLIDSDVESLYDIVNYLKDLLN